jgi:ribosomal-protein-alanine N-acetyltransferase
MKDPSGDLAIRPMALSDLPAVAELDRQLFPTPWPVSAYRRELEANPVACYLVLERATELVGFAGMWVAAEEAHITTIGVRPADQGRRLGRTLLAALVGRAFELGAEWISLEVRASNRRAIRLYQAFGLRVVGRRKKYYANEGEDALVMWSDSIRDPSFLTNLHQVWPELPGLALTRPRDDRQQRPPTSEGGARARLRPGAR